MANSPDSTENTPAGPAPSGAVEEQPASPLERLEARPTRLIGARARQQWREEFPYHWSADDLVTRRDTLRFLVAGSGALFLATAALAAAGALRVPAAERIVPIARIGELAVNTSKTFNYPDEFAQGILVNLPGKGLVAYSDVCTHLSCSVFYDRGTQQFHCPCHEGHFDAFTGDVLAGPPTRPLPLIEIAIRGDTVYAVREVER
jgi:nitrite reductase/ring-hydroxylating ferredoxin subunit